MTGKVIDNGATGFLILIIPLAMTAVIVATAWPILLALLLLFIIWQVWQQWQWQRFINQVNPAFNELIQENNGCITPLDLATKANLKGNQAHQFLDYKAKQFNAKKQELANQSQVYYFLTASAVEDFFAEPESLDAIEQEQAETTTISNQPGAIASASASVATSQPETVTTVKENATATLSADHSGEATGQQSNYNVSLIQAELARRLQVHSSTVGKRKLDPDFSDWTRQRDPENIPWQYWDETKLFYPVEQ